MDIKRREFIKLLAFVALALSTAPKGLDVLAGPSDPNTIRILGQNVTLIYRPLGAFGTIDPLNQYGSVGWETKINGERYGSCVIVPDYDDPEVLAQARGVIIEHAKQSIALILKKAA